MQVVRLTDSEVLMLNVSYCTKRKLLAALTSAVWSGGIRPSTIRSTIPRRAITDYIALLTLEGGRTPTHRVEDASS